MSPRCDHYFLVRRGGKCPHCGDDFPGQGRPSRRQLEVHRTIESNAMTNNPLPTKYEEPIKLLAPCDTRYEVPGQFRRPVCTLRRGHDGEHGQNSEPPCPTAFKEPTMEDKLRAALVAADVAFEAGYPVKAHSIVKGALLLMEKKPIYEDAMNH